LHPKANAGPERNPTPTLTEYTGPPDPAKWSYDTATSGNESGWGNHELQWYTDSSENAWVADGVLRICARKEDCNGKGYTSAKLVSKGNGDWQYCRVEVRAKLPTALGTWPAIWMLPSEELHGCWPKDGEIDIMEHVGMDCGQVHGTVHTEKYNHMKGTQVGRSVAVLPSEWHVYGVEWSEDAIVFFVDGRRYHQFAHDGGGWEAWPFDHPFHLILNVAVGGDWGGAKGVDMGAFSGHGQVMEVEWVRVYSRS